MHVRSRKPLQDALTATRLKHAGGRVRLRAASPTPRRTCARARGWRRCTGPSGWSHAALAGRCTFSLDELRYEYPREIVPAGHTPASWLRELTEQGVRAALSRGLPAAVRAQIEHELALIAQLQYEPYFLTVADIVQWARAQGILCQGRGSAANSAVCYCLGVTEVDPARTDAAVRALHQRRAQRAARHRHRLRAPAPRRGHPVHLPQVRPPPRRADRRGHQLPAALGAARRGPRARASTCSASTRSPRASSGSTAASIDAERLRENGFDPESPLCRLWVELDAAADRLPAPPVAAPGRLRHRARRARASWCRWRTPPCPTAASSSGTRTTSTRSACSRSTSWRWAC